MPSAPRGAPPGARLIRLIGTIVPDDHVAEWEAEWVAELDHRWTALERERTAGVLARCALLARCLGAIPDALWFRRHHGGDDMFAQDLRYAIRTLIRWPGFSAIVILTLALGIGANAAIFSVVNAVLLRPLPFADPARLVMVFGAPTDGDSAKVGRGSSYPDYADIRDQTKSFAHLAATRWSQVTLTGGDLEPTGLTAAFVTQNLFGTLGVSPALGRGFLPEEDRPGGPPVVVLSHRLWESRFATDPRVLGSQINLDGRPYTIIGVMPPAFRYPAYAHLYYAIGGHPGNEHRGQHSLVIVGRLAPGVPLERAESDVRTVAAQLEQQYPADNAKRTAQLVPMHEAVVGDVRPRLFVLLGAVGLVLLIGCTNVASLFLARAAAREREAAVRTALGAGRGRLVRQFLTESMLLAVIGGTFGLLVARWGVSALMAATRDTIPRASEVGIDGTALTFLFAVSMLTGLAFGTIPAVQFSRGSALASLKDMARGATAGVRRRHFRQALVVSEVALAMVLVIGAGLLIKSFWLLQRVEPGFNPERLLAVQIKLPATRYQERSRVRGFYRELRGRLDAMPEVQSTAVSFEHPLGQGWTSSFTVEGRPPRRQGEEFEARVRPVMPGYFKNVGVPLIKGRDVTDRDVPGAPGAVVINEAFAKQHFPGEDPIGKRLIRRPWWPEMPSSWEIVGVAANERFLGLRSDADAATYFSFDQFAFNEMWLLVRTRTDPLAFVPRLRREVWELDRTLPLDDVQTMEARLGESVADSRFNTALLALFAAVALALAAIGIYGVLSYSVAQRRGEIGIRMALGAPRGSVVRLVVGQGMWLAVIGAVLGIATSFAVTRVLSRLLFGVSTTDPWVFVAVAALLSGVAFFAAYVPARRASHVDPLVALRSE